MGSSDTHLLNLRPIGDLAIVHIGCILIVSNSEFTKKSVFLSISCDIQALLFKNIRKTFYLELTKANS